MSIEWSETIWCDKCGQERVHILRGDGRIGFCHACGIEKTIIREGKKVKAIPIVTLTHGGPERKV